MNENIFKKEMKKAQEMQKISDANYWIGYQKGLRQRYHGENFGTPEEHQMWLTLDGDNTRLEKARGYRDGFYMDSKDTTAVNIKEFDAQVWAEFKAEVIKKRIKIPEAAAEALRDWIKKQQNNTSN